MPGQPSINQYERKRLQELEDAGAPTAPPHAEVKRTVLHELAVEMGRHVADRLRGGAEAPPPDAPPAPAPEHTSFSAIAEEPLSARLLRLRNRPTGSDAEKRARGAK